MGKHEIWNYNLRLNVLMENIFFYLPLTFNIIKLSPSRENCGLCKNIASQLKIEAYSCLGKGNKATADNPGINESTSPQEMVAKFYSCDH